MMLAHRQLGGNTGDDFDQRQSPGPCNEPSEITKSPEFSGSLKAYSRENALMRHGRGRILGVLRRALAPVGRSDLLRMTGD
jgi:hypothetical protein